MIRKFLFLLAFTAGLASARDITATSWLVADESGAVLHSQNIDQVQPIASISKLMTVMVVVDAHQDLDERIDGTSRRDRIQLALVKSDNKSAALLCDAYPGGKDACVRAMNAKAQELHMTNTHFIEATGLSVFNVSTANELINLVQAASHYDVITAAAHTSTAKVRVKKRWFVFHNTTARFNDHTRVY